MEKLTRDERIKQKIKVVKDNQRINSSIYKDNIGIDDIIHNTGLNKQIQRGLKETSPFPSRAKGLKLNQNSKITFDDQQSSQYQ